MYIEPTTNIKLLSGVPLDATYEHTLWFDSAELQRDYFSSKTKYNLTNYTYQRVNRGVCRVGVLSDLIYDCNYMMFQNTSYGNKWFYAFIDSVEYVNNVTSEIRYTIDAMQTWLFNLDLKECIVEREHVSDDTFGLHTIDEGITLDVVPMEKDTHYYTDWSLIIQAIPNNLRGEPESWGQAVGRIQENIYTGASFYEFDINDGVEPINSAINTMLVNGYNIVGVYMCPKEFRGLATTDFGININRPRTISFPFLSSSSYTPKNNKCFISPYCFLRVSNGIGGKVDYKWENLDVGDASTVTFTSENCFINKVSCQIFPANTTINNDRLSQLSITDFPTCNWSENAFYSKIGSGFISDAISSIVNMFGSSGYSSTTRTLSNGTTVTKENLGLGGVSSTINKVSNYIGEIGRPSDFNGNGGDSYVNLAENKFGFEFYSMCPKVDEIKMLDEYFNVYGYKVNVLKKPQYNSRPQWNYVKTLNCGVMGSIPSDSKLQIANIFNKGITFWKNPDNVGNYSLSNK